MVAAEVMPPAGQPGGTGNPTRENHLDEDIAPGGTRVVTIDFRSPAKPQPYAQVAPQRGSVEVGGVTAGFSAVFRSTTGSLRNPRPYVQDTTAALTVTAPDVTLTRQADGTFAGRVPVTIRNNSDAPHYELGADIVTPEILNWPDIEPVGVCVNSGELPVPAGSAGIGCQLSGDQIAEGQVRTFHWLLTAPSETPVGPLGTGTTLVKLAGPAAAQTDAANIDSFNITVAG